jgi:hypothetical protein
VIHVGAIRQDHIGKGALVLVVAVRLDCDFFAKGEVRGGLLCTMAEGLAFLRAVDATEADTLSMVAIQYFDGVAIEDGDNGAGEVSEGQCRKKRQECREYERWPY